MKKLIYGVAALAVAAMMVACGGKTAEGISKGSKSKMDSLSYAMGVNIATDISSNMPEMKFDWAVLAAQAEKSLFTVVKEGDQDKDHEAAIEVLQSFFSQERPQRMNKFMEEARAKDSVAMPDFASFDIFAGDDAERKKVSEAYGCDLGTNLRASNIPMQTVWFVQGMNDVADGKATIDNNKAMELIQTYFTVTLPTKNAEASAKWLAEIEKQSGVKKTDSGLLYRIDRAGDETLKPKATDVVKVDYEGKLRTGKVFDSSYARGEAIEFPLNGVIPGWTEGVQLIGKGGQITLWIPAELAYGQRGAGSDIGPNEALEFKVELYDIKAMDTPEATEAK